MIRLRVVSSAEPSCVGKTFAITAERTRIGRGPDNDVVIDDAGLSRHHASLLRTPSGYTLVDEGSANGMWIGEARVGNVALGSDVHVRIGGTVLVLEDSGAAATILLDARGVPLGGTTPAPVPGPPAPRIVAPSRPPMTIGTGIGAGAIVGIVAGVLVVAAALVFFLVPGVPRWVGERIRGEASSVTTASASASTSTSTSTTTAAAAPTGQGVVATGADEGKPALLDAKDVQEGRALAIDGAKGGELVMSTGAKLVVDAGSYSGTQTVRLVRTGARAIAKSKGLLGELYIAAADDGNAPTKPLRLELPIDRTRFPDEATELAVFAVHGDGTPFVVKAKLDASRDVFVIERPAVHVLGLATHREGDAVPTPKPTGLTTGYTIAPIVAKPPPKCATGAAGEVHEEPGHAFRIHAGVATTCGHMRDVSKILQEAYEKFDVEFAKGGKKTFAGWLAADDRMDVTIGSTTAEFPEGEYNPFWGGGVMSVASVMASRGADYDEELRITLFHEMFHAVQDIYNTMFASKVVGRMWWMEATAEWAGRKYGRTSRTPLMQDLIAYGLRAEHGSPYVLRLPIDESRAWHKGYASYHYAMLIEHVEQQSPGYVKKALHSEDAVSGTILEAMYKAGKIDTSYASFLSDNATAIAPLVQLDGKIMDTKAQTRVWRPASADLDAKLAEPPEVFAKYDERWKVYSFPVKMAPATGRLFHVRGADGKPNVTLNIGLAKGGAYVDSGFTIVNGTPSRLVAAYDNRFEQLSSLGDVWVYIYRPWVPGESRDAVDYTLHLSLYIDCPRPGAITIGGGGARRSRVDPHDACLARNGYKTTYPPPARTLVMVDIPPTG